MQFEPRIIIAGAVKLLTLATVAVCAGVLPDAAFASSFEFEQPPLAGIAGNFLVPRSTHDAPPLGNFVMIFWQKNPLTPNGMLVPTVWPAGSQTGFTPAQPQNAQRGFQNKPGTTTAQMEGDVVGAYINSRDLAGAGANQKMMITPQYKFRPGSSPVPFAHSDSVLNSSMSLQVPVAEGNDTYVTADLLFIDPDGTRISFGVKLFSNGHPKPVSGYGFDQASRSFMLNTPLGTGQQFLTKTAGSTEYSATPWLGWRPFNFSISRAEFAAALNFLNGRYPNSVRYTDPSQYVLAEVHLNAEFHFEQSAPAELGWSMTNWKVWLTG